MSTMDSLPDSVDDSSNDGSLDAEVLPGWSRRHVLAHVAANARALRRLVAWARTGVETPMYASRQARDSEIETGSHAAASQLRAAVRESAAALAEDFASLPRERWRAEVRTAQGRSVPATEIVWMRTKELAVHAVDLAAGTDFADLPPDLCEALVDDVAKLRARRADGPAVQLTNGDRAWRIAGHGDPVTVTLPTPELAAWLTGRRSPSGLPALPRWL